MRSGALSAIQLIAAACHGATALFPRFDLNQRAAFLLVTIFICVLSKLETLEVSIDPVNELVQQCIVAQLAGANFPEVWHRILKNHSLVAGPVVQNHANGTPHLEVRLSNGKRLVYREHGYSIE